MNALGSDIQNINVLTKVSELDTFEIPRYLFFFYFDWYRLNFSIAERGFITKQHVLWTTGYVNKIAGLDDIGTSS